MRRHLMFVVWSCLVGCLPEGALKQPYEGYTPSDLGDGWPLSTPDVQEMDPDLLDTAFRMVHWEDGFLGARSLLVLRRGTIVAEAYPRHPDDAEALGHVQSITKTVVSMLAGIAEAEGVLADVGTPLSQVYPDLFDGLEGAKRDITLNHALNMSTGLRFEDRPNFLEFLDHDGDSAGYVLDQPLDHPPGTTFHYSDGDPQLVVKAIERGAEESVEQYARERLFEPLGITDSNWEPHPGDGTPYGGFGLFVRPRDLARLGQVLLDNGVWSGDQVLPPGWVERVTRVRSELAAADQYYGDYFWLNPALGTFGARGNGGQFLYVVPDEELVIVYTAAPSTSEYLNYEAGLVSTIVNSCF